MSSVGSLTTSTSSKIRQFGLYRSIDARTEEFLKLSKKRQLRQGCACAIISTLITVTVVVVILLIYEYAIAVEWSLVQNKKGQQNNDNINMTGDSPIADRLDRTYFGFDQDYYERMPLLVNAMQENSYVDPFIDMPLHKRGKHIKTTYQQPTTSTESYRKSIRRTSPRPFIYELRHPTPVPFSKTFGSKSWIESYRNAQRLKNVQQIIKYLEKTINAKVGDLHSLPSSTHIAFSGVYVEPMVHDKNTGSKKVEPTIDLLLESASKTEVIKSNHQSDPLFKYKPETPGDVNMLADNYFRFLPIPPSFVEKKEYPKIPIFKPIPSRNINPNLKYSASEIQTETTKMGIPKSFSVMLNLFPLLNTLTSGSRNVDTTKSPSPSAPQLDNIYFTTTRPQFRRKTIVPIKRTYYKRGRVLTDNKTHKHNVINNTPIDRVHQNESSKGGNMIVHINVYAPDKNMNDTQTTTENNEQQVNVNHVTDVPFQLSTSQVEDFHIGSSGVIPIESRFNPPPTLPVVTPIIPFFDITPSPTTTRSTNPPEIVKFSPEDAKVPDHYKPSVTPSYSFDENDGIEMNRRNSRDHIDLSHESYSPRTLVIKLKNKFHNNSTEITTETTTLTETSSETTTSNTRQINGHYRSVNKNSRGLSRWLDPNSEANRKRRLELFAKGFRRPSSYNSTYVEIKRNNTQITTTESS